MPRHGMQYCLLCNPFGNGTSGEDGTEAIGKYHVENQRGVDQHTTGWHGLCPPCARSMMRAGHNVIPLDGHENHPVFSDSEGEDETVEHDCDNPSWTKHSLVTEDGGFDWVRCDECDIWAKRHGIGSIEVVGYER